MPAAKKKYRPKPRYWSDAQVAARLNMSANYFSQHKTRFYKAGMPMPDALMRGTDSKALELWCDARSNLIDPTKVSGGQFDRSLQRVEGIHGAPGA